MNSKKLLQIFLLVVLLFAFVRAADEDEDKDSKEVEVADSKEDAAVEKEVEHEEKKEIKEPVEEEKKEVEKPKEETKPTPTTKPAQSKPSTSPAQVSKPTPKPQTQPQTQPKTNTAATQPKTNTAAQQVKSNTSAQQAPVANQKSTTSNNASSNNSNASQKSASNAAPAAANKAAATAAAAAAASTPVVAANGNAVVPQVNNAQANVATAQNANVNADGNVDSKNESSGHSAVTGTVISLVAVGAVVGVATVGVNVYKKRNSDDNTRGADLADIEAQPINTDFGAAPPMAPEDYNPYNIMNDAQNEPYITNNPYEYKPNYVDDEMTTTPFQKNEAAQDNFMSRESIFSNSGNIPQIGNDVFNFGDNAQLPYVQELPVENSYIEEPVKNEIQVENYEMPNSQMPTLVPVQPEIVITQPEEEPAQEGYKQIVPTVAQMEIIETPDFNNMTTSMIEDHINNMDLENLANTETQPTNNEETDGGYKQIVPDIQEAVIENFDIDDDEEDPDMSVVDNITDTYRAALRATYCSTTDDNRFSYRTVDSDHSLLHTMREDGEW